MARPWRDIFSANTFQRMITDKDYVKGSRAKLVLFHSKEHHLDKLYQAIRYYHDLDKTSANMLPQRRESLYRIHVLASDWFTRFKIDKVQAAIRQSKVPERVTDLKTAESLDRNVLTLERRSLRKSAYLEKLETYCRTANPQQLIDYINSPRDDSGDLLDLDPHVRMESEDFMHRNSFETGILREAFEQWAQGNHLIPFFLWLETHEVCNGDTKRNVLPVVSVEYFTDRTNVSDEGKFRIVTGPPLMCGNEVCDTLRIGYKAPSSKRISPQNSWSKGVAAFVWSAQNELFLCEHWPSKFHHSSLLSGQRVKNAGMIRIQDGLIVELSNNSGHYKPGIDHVLRFLDYYQSAMSYWCYLVLLTGGDREWQGTYNKFISGREEIIKKLRR